MVKTKERMHTKDIHQQFTHPFFFISIGNCFGDIGVAPLGESLNSNTTLTELNLRGEDKRKKTHENNHLQVANY